MESLKELYKIGPGPSSSHTLAPQRACTLFKQDFPEIDHVIVDLYGSLSLTGKGHLTDWIIIETFKPILTTVNFKRRAWNESFPNGFKIYGYKENKLIGEWTVFSIGGGSIQIKEKPSSIDQNVYPERNLKEINELCAANNWTYFDYVKNREPDILNYLSEVFDVMQDSCERGLTTDGILPGNLKMPRYGKSLYKKALSFEDKDDRNLCRLTSYAYAVNEENASGHTVVTAPTLGSCGILPALLRWCYIDKTVSRKKCLEALAVGGIFGNIIKTNATISGAVGGCQAEVGAACCMASAAYTYIKGGSCKQIEMAAEIAMEHHLGLTCDPVGGYVIIPCIERNAVGVLRAVDAARLAMNLSLIKDNRVSFDTIVDTMNYTGKKIAVELKETSLGGLARELQIQDSH